MEPNQAVTLFDSLIKEYKGTEQDFRLLREAHRVLSELAIKSVEPEAEQLQDAELVQGEGPASKKAKK